MENKFTTADIYVEKFSASADLYCNLWTENTTALLHAPRGVGKTAAAIEIACDLTAKGREVFYLTVGRLDLALLPKIAGNTRLYVHTPKFELHEDTTDYADIVIADIEQAITETKARIFIVDSLSRIAAMSLGRNSSPTNIMKRLVALQARYGISLLVIARDSTKSTDRALLNLADTEIPFENDRTNETTKTVGPYHGAAANPHDDAAATQPDATETSFKHSDAPRYIPTGIDVRKLSRRERRALERQTAKRLLRHSTKICGLDKQRKH